MSVWFTADIHFGHVNIIRYCGRPYREVEEMDEDIIARWNQIVQPDDDVMILGDLCMGNITSTLRNVRRLVGHKVLLLGNHDRPFGTTGAKRLKFMNLYLDAGLKCVLNNDQFPNTVATRIADRQVRLNHFPYNGDSYDRDDQIEDRFQIFRSPDEGDWLLHGHTHTAWRQKGRQINVGIDAWGGYPVPEQMIAQVIAGGVQDLPIIPWAA